MTALERAAVAAARSGEWARSTRAAAAWRGCRSRDNTAREVLIAQQHHLSRDPVRVGGPGWAAGQAETRPGHRAVPGYQPRTDRPTSIDESTMSDPEISPSRAFSLMLPSAAACMPMPMSNRRLPTRLWGSMPSSM